jgi:hypothetical protein
VGETSVVLKHGAIILCVFHGYWQEIDYCFSLDLRLVDGASHR